MNIIETYKNPIKSPEYCEEVSKQLLELDLKQLYFYEVIESDDDKKVFFVYDIPKMDYDKYNSDECINDINEIRNVITAYLNNNKTNVLNNKLITFIFQTLPGHTIYMFNFNSDRNLERPEGFRYFKNLYADLSSAQEFSDARIIELTVDENDDITVLEDWENLEYLNISGKCLTEEKQEYLREILPECTIICNGEIINEGNIDNMN